MPLWLLALMAGLGPALAVMLSWYVSVTQGHVLDCNPFVEGCTSISRTGRHGSAFFLFKALMLPSAVMLALFWWAVAAWLQRVLGLVQYRRSIWALGLLSALCLALYSCFLGVDGALSAGLRRTGATLYFSAGFLAQLLLVIALGDRAGAGLARLLGVLVGLQFALGLLSLPATAWAADKDYWENVIEWCFAAAMIGFFPVLAWPWRRLSWAALRR